MFWFLFGVMLVLLIRNQFDMQGVIRDVRKIAKAVRAILRDLGRTVRTAVKDAKKEKHENRKTCPEKGAPAEPAQDIQPLKVEAQDVQPERAEALEDWEGMKELEMTARTAAMLANVPTIDFPKEDPKYDSARKYRYA